MARHFVAASAQRLSFAGSPLTVAPLTIAAWFKPTTVSANRGLVSLSAFASTNQFFELYLDSGTQKVAAQTGGSLTSAAAMSTTTLTVGAWNHACGVFTSTSSRSAFLNGSSKGIDATSCGNPSPAPDTTGVGIYDTVSTHFFPFDGDLADVAIWNVALTNDEVVALAAGVSPLKIRPASLVAYWPLAGVASPEPDVIGSSNLTVTGATAATSQALISPAASVAAVVMNGSNITSSVRIAGIRISDTLNSPKDCSFRMDGSAPAIGSDLKVLVGDTISTRVLFAGTVVKVSQGYEGKNSNLCWDVYAQDYTYLLNRRRPFGIYTRQSVSTIAQSLIAAYASGFSSSGVAASLASIAIAFDGSNDFMACLRNLATVAGAYCYVDAAKDVHLFTSEATDNPDTIDGTGSLQLAPPVISSSDTMPVRTRVYVKGIGTSTAAAGAAGQPFLPIQSSAGFAAGGGSALVGGQVVAYTGASPSGPIAAPVVTWSNVNAAGGTGPLLISHVYDYVCTFVTALGESVASNVSNSVNSGNDGAGHALGINMSAVIPIIPTAVTSVKFYRRDTTAGATDWNYTGTTFFRAFSYSGGGDYLCFGNDSQAGSGAVHPPTTSTAGNDGVVVSSVTSALATAVGATQISVGDNGLFFKTGGVATYVANNVTYAITYTSRDTGGHITGVPASGLGSITVQIPASTPIVNVPGLTGVATLSAAFGQGDSVNIWVQRDDATAQSNLAALEGGDGIHENVISDTNLSSITDCQTRGDADLALFKAAIVTITYATRDYKTRSGKTVTVSLPSPTSLSGTFKIQRVTIDQIDQAVGRLGPRFSVEAANTKFSLEDLLRKLTAVAA